MNRRRILALAAVALVLLLGGCLGSFGGDGGLSEDDLDADADYEWDGDTDVYVIVDTDRYRAVYDLGNETTFELSSSSFLQDQAIDIEAVRYRYPNGTEVLGSELAIEQDDSSTVIEVPAGNGTLAFSGPSSAKEVVIPGLVEGSYTVELPAGFRVGNFFLSDVRPTHGEESVVDDRHVLTWSEVDDDIYVQFYLWRDHYLFWGILLGLTGIAIGGVLYYRRQINRLARRRQAIGPDVHDEDE